MSINNKISAKRVLKTFVISITLVITVLVGTGYLYVNQAGGLQRLLESELSLMAGSGNARVGSANLKLSLSQYPFQLTANEIIINFGSDQIELPRADIRFGIASLLDGQPEMILLKGVKLDLVSKKSGWSGSPALLLLDWIAKDANKIQSKSAQLQAVQKRLKGIKLIIVETDRLTLSDELAISRKLSFEDIYIEIKLSDKGKVFGKITGDQKGDDVFGVGKIALSFEGWPGNDNVKFDLKASKLNTEGISNYFSVLPNFLHHVGVLSGDVGLTVKDRSLHAVDAEIELTDGKFMVPGFDDHALFSAGRLAFSYKKSDNSLSVKEADFKLEGDQRLSFNGFVRNLQKPSSMVNGVVKATNFSTQSIIETWPKALSSDLKHNLGNLISGGYFKFLTANVNGSFASKSGTWDSLTVDLDSQFADVRANISAGQYQRIVSTVEGKLAMDGITSSSIEKVTVDVKMGNGSILVNGFERPVELSSGAFRSIYIDGELMVEHMAIDMGSLGAINLDGSFHIEDQRELKDLKFNIIIPDIDITLFSALWPDWASPKTRDWVSENIPVGRIMDANLSLSADIGAPHGMRNIYDINGSMELHEAQIKWAKNATPLTNVDASIQWNSDNLTAVVASGRLGDIRLREGRVVITPIMEKFKKTAFISLRGEGKVNAALKLAREAELRKYGSLDFEKIEADGEIEISLRAEVPFEKKQTFASQVQTLNAVITNGSFHNLPNQMTLEKAELKMNFMKTRSKVSGTAIVNGVSSSFGLEVENQSGRTKISGSIPQSKVFAQSLADASGINIVGVAGGKFDYLGDILLRDAKLSLTVDLRGTAVQVPELGWSKLSAESGRANMTVSVKDGKLSSIQDINLVAGSMSASGKLAFDRAGQLSGAFFERAAWPSNDVRDLIVRKVDNATWSMKGDAKLLDLRTVFNKDQSNWSKNLGFSFSGNQIFITDRVSLSGHLKGSWKSDGNADSAFQGVMFIDENPWLTETNMTVQSTSNDNKVTATGLIGGGEATLLFQSGKERQSELVIKSKNGGKVLSGLGVTDTIRGGRLELRSEFKDKQFKSYSTKILIEKFHVVEAPRAIRAFSVLSLVGLYSLVEGDGTSFRRGEADLEIQGPLVNVKTIKASGDAVGIAMTGIYNRSSKKVNVSGNLVPANLISKTLGSLPILGDLITGADKSGVFVTQFKVTGTSDDMKTSVNPVSSIAPGLLRDFFSPDWLGKERDRLLGEDETSRGVVE